MMPPPPKPAPRKINSKKVAASTVTVKSEQIENLASQRPLRSTRGKRLVPQPIVQPKSEKLSNEAPAVEKTNVTLESVYEDAITEDQSAGSSKPFEIEVCCLHLKKKQCSLFDIIGMTRNRLTLQVACLVSL